MRRAADQSYLSFCVCHCSSAPHRLCHTSETIQYSAVNIISVFWLPSPDLMKLFSVIKSHWTSPRRQSALQVLDFWRVHLSAARRRRTLIWCQLLLLHTGYLSRRSRILTDVRHSISLHSQPAVMPQHTRCLPFDGPLPHGNRFLHPPNGLKELCSDAL